MNFTKSHAKIMITISVLGKCRFIDLIRLTEIPKSSVASCCKHLLVLNMIEKHREKDKYNLMFYQLTEEGNKNLSSIINIYKLN